MSKGNHRADCWPARTGHVALRRAVIVLALLVLALGALAVRLATSARAATVSRDIPVTARATGPDAVTCAVFRQWYWPSGAGRYASGRSLRLERFLVVASASASPGMMRDVARLVAVVPGFSMPVTIAVDRMIIRCYPSGKDYQ